ncbi:nitroreductase [Novosphingobium decolorationis]|uniref:Nitroreductase n=1 Tax=Novosphingobium decolorationis TaxID=2698673 RepID=A0ABX8E118_9SPHN|nr:nitroreductase [Novosphingobium decolorationis]QVM82837.1 nitroreductase [Novosphingobium decolorationis]
MNVTEAVASRRSIRAYTDEKVPLDVLTRVLDKARMAPSGCNFQPWEATVLTGEPLKALQARLLPAERQDPIEYSYSEPQKSERYLPRLQELGAQMYGAMGIARDDKESRNRFVEANKVSFGAPVLMLIYMERLHAAPQWSDVGMWLQTIMLLLREEGLDSCPQEWMSDFGRLIKDHIGVSDETHILFCGLAIGYGDRSDPVNQFERTRTPLEDQVRFAGF